MLRRLFGQRRGSASVEFALISTFLLLPLFGGSVDMVEYLSAKAQINTALQALYYYALTYSPGSSYTPGTTPTNNPASTITSSTANAMVALMNTTLHPLTLTSGPTLSYQCVNSAGTPKPSFTATSYNSCTDSNYPYTQIFVSFTVSSAVYLSMPVPFIQSYPLTISNTGTIEIL